MRVLFCFAILIWAGVAQAKATPGKYFVKLRTMNKWFHAFSMSGAKVEKTFPELSLISITAPPAFAEKGMKLLAANPNVEYIEPVYEVHADMLPNDPKSRDRRGLDLAGAWDITTGNKNVVIAISDTGINWDHEDLKENMWVNKKEIPGNGIDDDHNGFVDDIYGWNFYKNNPDAKDDNDHGSHVAGLAAGVGNNGKGIAGVTWHAQLMATKFLSGGGSGTIEGAVETILYAVNNGAHIINASWGGPDYSQALIDAIHYAGEHGVLFVCAAGNDSANVDRGGHYPAGHSESNMIVVAATTGSGRVASFSNVGRTRVHVAAPGVDLVSSTHYRTNSYASFSGTSMASPLVAGVAALILSVRPDISLNDLRNAIMNSVRPGSKSYTSAGGTVSATTAVSQLEMGNQVWPKRVNLKIGENFTYTAWGVKAPFKWETNDSAIATVDANGKVTALTKGETQVAVVDANGNKIQTEALVISR